MDDINPFWKEITNYINIVQGFLRFIWSNSRAFFNKGMSRVKTVFGFFGPFLNLIGAYHFQFEMRNAAPDYGSESVKDLRQDVLPDTKRCPWNIFLLDRHENYTPPRLILYFSQIQYFWQYLFRKIFRLLTLRFVLQRHLIHVHPQIYSCIKKIIKTGSLIARYAVGLN